MFDIGFFELIMIAIVGLFVVGPQRLPGVIRKIMLWRGQIQNQFSQLKNTLEQEIGAEEIRQQIHNDAILRDYKKGQKLVDDLNQEMQSLNKQANKKAQDLQESVVEQIKDTD